MNAIGNYLCFLDIFTINSYLRLSLKSDVTQKTFIGRFCTFLIIILSILAFFYFSLDMINKLNPAASVSEMSTPDPEFYALSKDSFYLLFGIVNLNNSIVYFQDETLFQVSAVLRVKNGSFYEDTPFDVGVCEINDLPNDPKIRAKYIMNESGAMYCIKNYSNGLIGKYNSPNYNALLFTVQTCRNTSQKSICKSPELIEQHINQLKFKFFYTDIGVDPFNYEQPITQYVDDFYGTLSYRLQTWIQMGFQHIDVNTDDGFLSENLHLNKGLKANDLIYMYSIVTGGPILVLDINLQVSKKAFTRKYLKIQDVLAQTGGILKFFLLSAYIITYLSIKLEILQKLSNKVFIYVTTSFENKDFDKKNSSEKLELKSRSFYDIIKTEKKFPFHLNLFQFFVSQYDRTKKALHLDQKKKLYDFTDNYLEKILDVSFLVKKLMEIDKLKHILFDKNQLFLFNKLNQPIVCMDKENNITSNLAEINENSLEDSISLNESKFTSIYNEISNKTNKSEIEERILKSLQEEFVIFKESEKNAFTVELSLK